METIIKEMATAATAVDAEDQIDAIKKRYQADIERNDYLRELLITNNPYNTI